MLIVKEIPIKYFRPFLAHQFPHFVTCDLNYSVEIQNEMSNSFSTTYNQISIIYAISITYMYFGAFWASGTVPSAWYQIKDRSESNSFSFTSLNKLLTSQVAWLKKNAQTSTTFWYSIFNLLSSLVKKDMIKKQKPMRTMATTIELKHSWNDHFNSS